MGPGRPRNRYSASHSAMWTPEGGRTMSQSRMRVCALFSPITAIFLVHGLAVLTVAAEGPSASVDERVTPAETPSAPVAATTTALVASDQTVIQASIQQPTVAAEHPLAPALRLAREGLATIDRDIKDYSCTLIKRERLGGRLHPHQTVELKVRHEPFSVYMRFLSPKKLAGRECLYVAGQNDDMLIAHEGQGFLANLPSIKIDPRGSLASAGQRYPITDIGIRRLSERLVETSVHDLKYDEAELQTYPDIMLRGRKTLCVQVTHPLQRSHFRYHVARVFVDSELQVPIRYVGYLWPKKPGGKPQLDEEYTYLDLKINNGFTDLDFDRENPEYNF